MSAYGKSAYVRQGHYALFFKLGVFIDSVKVRPVTFFGLFV